MINDKLIMVKILTSESCLKGNSAPFIGSLLVDEEMMRLDHWFWVMLCFLQCFDTVGWGQEGRTAHKNNLCHLSQNVHFWDK